MPTQSCNNTPKQIAQTLFLGASVASYNVSAGWGSQPSQLTVNLIEDEKSIDCRKPTNGIRPNTYTQFPDNQFAVDHYNTCNGIDCYVDKYTGQSANINTPIENRIIPGKVYYTINTTNGKIESNYWIHPDPGFFGNQTKIALDGMSKINTDNSVGNIYKYDIIDTPVYFNMGKFTFGGFVQSWNKSTNSGGKQYTVTINSASSILNSCYIILDKFAGSVFSKSTLSATIFGSPKNFIKKSPDINYDHANLNTGVLPNVFNVYGFLESFGVNNFGGAGKNQDGISLNYVMDALSVLTSAIGSSTLLWEASNPNLTRSAFSTFGRIISKCMVSDRASDMYDTITAGFNGWGVIPPQTFETNVSVPSAGQRCQFALDLNDLIYTDRARKTKRMPDGIRISNPVISIMELINIVAEKIGHDVYIEMVPTYYRNQLINVIKVKAISRLQQPRPNIIENTIKEMQCNNYEITGNSFGKEKNETAARAMILGGQQQRLYQVKSYRLAYSQSNFIYNPQTGAFVNYRKQAGPTTSRTDYNHGKIRLPNCTTTRNPDLNTYLKNESGAIGLSYHDIVRDEDDAQGTTLGFMQTDPVWDDTAQTGAGLSVTYGNYAETLEIKSPTSSLLYTSRWIPLYMDTICPFFGFMNDDTATVSVNKTSDDTNTDYRQIRPVWFDSWTGQIVVVIHISELPELNISLTRLSLLSGSINHPPFPLPYYYTRSLDSTLDYFTSAGKIASRPDQEYFYITESEIRAALAGFDNFLVYSLAKTFKPDIIEMVRRAYYLQSYNLLISKGASTEEAKKTANAKTDWYWKLLGGNIGGDSLYPISISPDKADGSQYIQEKALQDLKLLHKFVTEVGKYYGKKYMVTAWDVQAYKDESTNGTCFSTAAGYGYIFSGDGKLTYNYIPTNDGAWEEYGNTIDDCIVVGSPEWYNITDESGKIKPLLGYNNNYNFDYIRHAKCSAANSSNISDTSSEWNQTLANPYFSFSTWLTLHEAKNTSCTDTYVFPSIDLSSLSSSEYIIIDQKQYTNTVFSNVTSTLTNSALASYDAWATQIRSPDGPLTKSKVFATTTVEEDFIFLDAINKQYAKILIDAPGISLYMSSEDNAKDPNRTVITNVAAEDLLIYYKTRVAADRDYSWIRYMINYIVSMSISNSVLGGDILYGTIAAASNSTANNVELAPKAAHPFFAGIPIKSNQYIYGPWTNYPRIEGTGIFPPGKTITQTSSDTPPPTCVSEPINIDESKVNKAIDNMITSIDIEANDDLVPWNYGGMYNLDLVAYNEIETKINYQTVIETAQVDMPGLPIFNLGGNFTYMNIGLGYAAVTKRTTTYTAVSYTPSSAVDFSAVGGSLVTTAFTNTSTVYNYDVVDLLPDVKLEAGPIISNIQTSVGQQGISTTYTFRTYTRKIGLFNKEETDRLKRLAKINLQRNKQISNLYNQMQNIKQQQLKFMTDERLNKAEFGTSDLSSKLFGWSPSMVMIAQAKPYIEEPLRSPKYIEDHSLYSSPGGLNTQPGNATAWKIPSSNDIGDTSIEKDNYLTPVNNMPFLKSLGRIVTTVGLYERKEVGGQLDKNYGMQSAMSLDGLFSPISFYPTDQNATYPYSIHDTARCPFCKGTKIITRKLSQYLSNGARTPIDIKLACDKCSYINKKLNATLNTDNVEIPINLITLNPILVPKGEFKNSNSQYYDGVHPDKLHSNLSNIDGYSNKTRYFRDRLRHCIEIVARGSVSQNKAKYHLETSKNLSKASANLTSEKNNLDYHHLDLMLHYMRDRYADTKNNTIVHENNQRFIGLRGPLVMHAWGYDSEGYPTPNAADEPYSFDTYGRPLRFKIIKNISSTSKPYKSLSIGEAFQLNNSVNSIIYAKTFNEEYLPDTIKNNANTQVYTVKIENNLKLYGGYDPTQGYIGDIIGKTQKWTGSRWLEKIKTNDFYLNWGERPDLWKVGPIDLSWDEERKVWAGGSGCEEKMPPYIITNSNDITSLDEFLLKKNKKNCSYRHVYITLEEDLIKQPDFDETYATRAFIDDIEYSKDPLLRGYRRLVYVKDKCGYTAPRGAKLLCRYDRFTGFYEPISKPVIMAKGIMASSTSANIDLNYIQGRRAGSIPTILFNIANPMGFAVSSGKIGMFSFINGSWTLISVGQ